MSTFWIANLKLHISNVEIIKLKNYRKIKALGLSFPRLLEYPKYPKTGITQPSDNLDTLVRPHSMWNVKLKIPDYFLFVPAHELGYLDPFFLNCVNTQLSVRQV